MSLIDWKLMWIFCIFLCQVRHLFIDGQQDLYNMDRGEPIRRSVKLSRRGELDWKKALAKWCNNSLIFLRSISYDKLMKYDVLIYVFGL